MKLRTLSAIACTALVGLGLLSGCGSSSAPAGASAVTSIVGVDGYVVDLNGSVVTAYCTDTNTTYSTTDLVNTSGLIRFARILDPLFCNVTIPSTVFIDSGDSVKRLGFNMMGRAKEGAVVSHLTTLAQAQSNTALRDLAESFDPVKAITDATSDNNATKNKAQRLLVFGEIAKTVLSGGNAANLASITIPTDLNDTTKTLSDLNVTAATAGLPGPLQTAAVARANVISAIIPLLPTLRTAGVDLVTTVTNISDGGKDLNASVGDVNISSIDTTSVTNAISTATTAVASLPAKLSVGSIKIGTQTVALNGNSFTATVDTADKNITSFYNVSFPSVSLTKGFSEQTVGLNVKISDANANQVTLSIAGAKLAPNDTNTSVKITLPTTSTITVGQTGLAALQAVIGTSASANPTTQLVMNDLAFDVDTLLGSINSSQIPTAIDALNAYIQKSGVYDVNISFSGLDANLTTDYTSFVGKVTVKGDTTAPVAPTLGDVNATSLVVTAEAGSLITIKNGTTTIATAVATGSAQTVTFTALTASATLSVTATDTASNVSTVATKTFTYVAPVTPTIAFDSTMVNDAVNGALNATSNTAGSYTLKVKTAASAPASTGTALNLYVSVNGATGVQVPVHVGYAAGTNFQIGAYSGTTLVAVSSVYTLTQADVTAGETVGDINVTVQ